MSINGITKFNGYAEADNTIRAYDRETDELVGETTTGSAGTFSLAVSGGSGIYYVIAIRAANGEAKVYDMIQASSVNMYDLTLYDDIDYKYGVREGSEINFFMNIDFDEEYIQIGAGSEGTDTYAKSKFTLTCDDNCRFTEIILNKYENTDVYISDHEVSIGSAETYWYSDYLHIAYEVSDGYTIKDILFTLDAYLEIDESTSHTATIWIGDTAVKSITGTDGDSVSIDNHEFKHSDF